MALKVALQMDPIGSVNIDGDSTYRIGLEAQARGVRTRPYTLAADGRRAYAYLPLTFDDGTYSLAPQQ